MVKIGYEFEVLTLHDDSGLEVDLADLFGAEAEKFEITTDVSIDRGRNCKKRDGWWAWEIITPPQPKSVALQTLLDMQHYLSETNAVTNASTGLHVNISSSNISKLDPMTLISVIDEHKIANSFNRTNNVYCVPWHTYFTRLQKRISRDKSIVDSKGALIYNAISLVNSVSRDEDIEDDAIFAAKIRGLFPKFTTINTSKLQDGYVEFRMIGGKDYHEKEVYSVVKELAESVVFASKGRNKTVIKDYFNQYWE